MLETDTTLLSQVSTSIVAAFLALRPVLHTDPTLLNIVGTSIVVARAACFNLRPMFDADPSLYDNVSACLVATLLALFSWRTTALAFLGRNLSLRRNSFLLTPAIPPRLCL